MVLPIDHNQWEHVAAEFNPHATDVESMRRNGEGLKANFHKLA